MVQSVQESTQKTYGVGWRRWLAFSNWFGTDPYLRAVPCDWVPSSEESPTAFQDFVVISLRFNSLGFDISLFYMTEKI
jgi:hypothetical protein